jgi:N-succinyldiaminopimelate aminotransferase
LISDKLRPFGTSIFGEMTQLAKDSGAINLSQGYPDFEGPPDIAEAVARAMADGHNQYARGMGAPVLVDAIARQQERDYGITYDPSSEIMVTNGATEGIAVSLLGILNPGDEVILFEPFYDSYPACVAMAGATARYYTLRAPDFALDRQRLAALFNDKTRVLMLNSPQNPTGKVFDRAELQVIAELCIEHDVIVISDEVYEHLTFDGAEHLPISTLPGMSERTLRLSSAGKTYSYTGWKIGWAVGPAPLVAAARAAAQFTSYATSSVLQHGIAHALNHHGNAYLTTFRAEYKQRRDLLVEILRSAGFDPIVPRGTYFIVASFDRISDADDVAFARKLTGEARVAAIPPSFFYTAEPEEGRRLLRFAFCKRIETLELAGERLRAFAGSVG